MRGSHEVAGPWWRRPRPPAPAVIMAPVALGFGLLIGGVVQVARSDTRLSMVAGLAEAIAGGFTFGAALAYLARPTRR